MKQSIFNIIIIALLLWVYYWIHNTADNKKIEANQEKLFDKIQSLNDKFDNGLTITITK